MKAFALGRLPQGQMNATEREYSLLLESRKQAGDVLWYKFEGFKLRLADNTFYTPDFAVMNADCSFECIEVKGFWMEDAKVKIKVAAGMYPFQFTAVRKLSKKDGGGFSEEVF